MYCLYMYSIYLLLLLIPSLECTVTFKSPQEGDVWFIGQSQNISWTEVTVTDNPNSHNLYVTLIQVFHDGMYTGEHQSIASKFSIPKDLFRNH